MGGAYSYIALKDRAAVKANLRVIFPHYSRRKISKITNRVFINFAKYLVDFFRFEKLDKEYIKKNVKIEGIDYLNKAISKNRGVIMGSAHIGNWELGAVVLAQLGYDINVVALNHRHKNVDDFFTKQRQIKGVKSIKFGGALRKCFVCLKRGGLLALVGDRDYFGKGIPMEFFGRESIIPRGLSVLGLKFGAPIVPTFLIRNPDETFTFKFYAPIETDGALHDLENVKNITKRFIDVMEEEVKTYPDQWYVFRRFWEKIEWKI